MSKVKIIHCSDFHFDTPFTDYDRVAAEGRKEDLRETFQKIISLAKEEDVKIILISGDFFDNDTVSYETMTLIRKSFEQVPQIKIFISPGNHDPNNVKTFYSTFQWPDNVHIFKELIERIDIEELNLSVYGYGFGKHYQREGVLNGFIVEDNSKINIMVMHGEVVKGNSLSDYNPITEQQISGSGLDYLALGHVHSFSGINLCGNTRWCYPGCPEGRGFDELGPKGVILGEVGKGYINLSFLELCKRRQEVLEIDISDSENYEDIVLRINKGLGLHSKSSNIGEIYDNLGKDMYKIILKGKVEKEFKIKKEVLLGKLKDQFYYVKIKDVTDIKTDYDALAKEYSIKGLFAKKMLTLIDKEENEQEKSKLKLSLRMGLEALDYREVTVNED